MEYHVGFTGTRKGMTPEQRHSVRTLLAEFKITPNECWFHHGDCVGSDAEAHEVAKALGYKIHVHPPEDDTYRAYCTDYDKISEPKPYRKRNTDIVRASLCLVAAVLGTEGRSGTWMTIGIAQKLDTVAILVYPSGLIDNSNWREITSHE